MKVYINKRGSIVGNQSVKNSVNNSILNEIYLKQKKNKEILMEEKITKIVNDIKQKLSEGKDIQKITLEEVKDIDSIIEFILNKNSRRPNDIIVIRQFLMSFSSLSEILSLNDKFNDTSDLVYKISSSLKKEEIAKNEILFLNGQLGKTFYLILQGEVSVLIPIQYSVQITCSQFYQYMEFLLDNKEYELIRLSFKSNEQLLKERNFQNLDQYEKFLGLLDNNLPANAKYDPCEINAYMDKFTNFVNKILEENSKLEEMEAKKKEEEKKKKEKEKEKQKAKAKENKKEENGEEENEDEDEEDIINNEENENEEKLDENKFNLMKFKFCLWKYFIVCDLNKGKSFGEVALKKGDNRRTATIMTKTDCIFGILEKDEYQSLIKEFVEKARKINTESIMKSKLFQNYREDLFDTHFFNCFKAMKKYKGEYLFKQNEKREYIFFIKKGDVQIEYFSSWYDLDKILDALGNKNFKNKKTYNNLVNSNEKLGIFCSKKQKFNISIYSSGEIVGLEEHLYPGTDIFMLSAVCLSECEIFSLEIEFIEKIVSEKILKHNYVKLNNEKKEKLIQRLLILKSNILYQYNNMIEDKFLINEKMKENDKIENYELKNRNIVKTRKKLVLISPVIKTEINNYSLEKKNLNKNILKINFQNQMIEKSLLSSQTLKKPELINSPFKKNTPRIKTIYRNENNTFRESNKKLSTLNNFLIKSNDNNIKNNINNRYKTIQKFQIKNNTEDSTPKINNYQKKPEIKFPVKGKVPRLLFDNIKTINQVIDKLISKEKDLCYNLSENRKNLNEKQDNAKLNNMSHRKFISHLELLGFDKMVDKISIKNKKPNILNSKENYKSADKIKLQPIPKLTNQKFNFNLNKNNKFH